MMTSPNPLPPPTNPKRSKPCEKKSCLSNPGALNLPESPKEPEALKARYGKIKVMPITSIKPKIMGLVLHGGRIQFFLHGTYSAGLVRRQGRLSRSLSYRSPTNLECFR